MNVVTTEETRRVLSLDERGALLDGHIAEEALKGWNIVTMTDTGAILARPRKQVNHGLHLLLTMLTGVWFIVWILVSAFRRQAQRALLTVDEFGHGVVTTYSVKYP